MTADAAAAAAMAANEVLTLAGEASGKIIGQLAALYACLVAALHAKVGPAVGARFLQRLVSKLDATIRSRAGAAAQASALAVGSNLALIFAHLYVFKVLHCSAVYGFVRRLVDAFGTHAEAALEQLLALLRVCGAALRADDPAALKDIIVLAKERAKALHAEAGGETGGGGAGGAGEAADGEGDSGGGGLAGRSRFLLDFIADLQNNRTRRRAGAARVAEEEVARLGKWLRTYVAATGALPAPPRVLPRALWAQRRP